ncbi:MAG: amidohydrolase family protein [Balneolaceae bacterium]
MNFFKFFTGLFLALLLLTLKGNAQIAVKGKTVHIVSGEAITNGVVLIKDGKIERVGEEGRVRIPGNYTIYEAEVVTPGLIDAHTVVGLAGILNQDHDQDQLETSHAIQPELRAIDAYNAREELVTFLRDKGITTIHTGHGPGAVISGQTMIVKTSGESIDEALIDSVTALAITLGPGINRNFSTPGSRSKAVAMLRQELIKAKDYAVKQSSDDNSKKPSRDLKMEALAGLLDGSIYAMITAHKANDIMTALRLKEEFGFKLLLDGVAEAYLVIDQIRESGVPVIIHPTMIRTRSEAQNASFETAAKLHEAGIPIVFQSGFESYVPKTRVALFEAAIAVANGLNHSAAIKALTLDAATILGIDDRVGSIERGKDADLVLFNGDPFEYTTKADHVIINGEVQ